MSIICSLRIDIVSGAALRRQRDGGSETREMGCVQRGLLLEW